MADQRPNDFVNLTANGTTTIGGAGQRINLHRIIVNKAGATANILQVYSGASAALGKLIGTFDTTALREINFFGLSSNSGFTFVLGTGTAADVTILFE